MQSKFLYDYITIYTFLIKLRGKNYTFPIKSTAKKYTFPNRDLQNHDLQNLNTVYYANQQSVAVLRFMTNLESDSRLVINIAIHYGQINNH